MIEGIIFMLGLGIVCAAILTAASRIFYVYEDPRIAQVEACFSEEVAVAEAKRCLQCGDCSDCRVCEPACEAAAIDLGGRRSRNF